MDTIDQFTDETPGTEPEEIPERFPELILDRPADEGEETVAVLDEIYLPLPQKKRIRPEWILGLIALLAAILLIAVAMISRPYYEPADDPEALADPHDP